MRESYYPPALNRVPAHLSLFHHLPGDELEAIREWLSEVCARTAPLRLRASKPRSLGRGVAITIESEMLVRFHAELAARWKPWLTPQDRQPFRPHITVQNKASGEEARSALEEIGRSFSALDFAGEGVALWAYLGGPWEPIQEFPFLGI